MKLSKFMYCKDYILLLLKSEDKEFSKREIFNFVKETSVYYDKPITITQALNQLMLKKIIIHPHYGFYQFNFDNSFPLKSFKYQNYFLNKVDIHLLLKSFKCKACNHIFDSNDEDIDLRCPACDCIDLEVMGYESN